LWTKQSNKSLYIYYMFQFGKAYSNQIFKILENVFFWSISYFDHLKTFFLCHFFCTIRTKLCQSFSPQQLNHMDGQSGRRRYCGRRQWWHCSRSWWRNITMTWLDLLQQQILTLLATSANRSTGYETLIDAMVFFEAALYRH
jgi:hypothetical protein